jgi:predicted GH43/DUF377 family glycosyl hydrolase
MELDDGWLLIYHGVNFEEVYSLGLVMLDKKNPEKVTYRSQTPILRPVMDYERFGEVSNVVFSCGSVKIDDQLLIYYGGADTVLCVATYDLNELTPNSY